MHITFSAPGLRVDFLADKRLRLLSPPGELVVELPDSELQSLVESAAKTLCEQKGAKLESIHVDVQATPPRSARLIVRAKARKIIAVTATVSGLVTLDESLAASLSDLSIKSEGMLAGMIEAAVRPKLTALEGRRFPLAGKLPPWLLVTDVALITGSIHRVVAKLSTAG
jgi:hypothetical protein